MTVRAAIFHSVETLRAIDRLEAILPAEAASADAASRTRTPLMAGNWKMNPATLQEAESLAALVAAAVRADDGAAASACDVLVCPPAPFLPAVAALLQGTKVQLGAQNIHHAASGAYTGETSLSMAASVGCSFVLVGHSERRELFGETDEIVGVKTRAILDAGMKAVVCIGESKEQYEAGAVKDVCAAQLEGALASVSVEEMAAGRVVVAYEPVWAIGRGYMGGPFHSISPPHSPINHHNHMTRRSLTASTRVFFHFFFFSFSFKSLALPTYENRIQHPRV